MTAREMTEAIGKPVYFVAGNLKFACSVLDVKIGYGQPRFLLQPMAGVGERWVEFSSIEPMPDINTLRTSNSVPYQNRLTSSVRSDIIRA
jgi:hypothetical protein